VTIPTARQPYRIPVSETEVQNKANVAISDQGTDQRTSAVEHSGRMRGNTRYRGKVANNYRGHRHDKRTYRDERRSYQDSGEHRHSARATRHSQAHGHYSANAIDDSRRSDNSEQSHASHTQRGGKRINEVRKHRTDNSDRYKEATSDRNAEMITQLLRNQDEALDGKNSHHLSDSKHWSKERIDHSAQISRQGHRGHSGRQRASNAASHSSPIQSATDSPSPPPEPPPPQATNKLAVTKDIKLYLISFFIFFYLFINFIVNYTYPSLHLPLHFD